MKVLAVSNPGVGHVNPMLPLSRALAEAGHDVRFATAARFCGFVSAAGFRAMPAGLDWVEAEAEQAFPELRSIPLAERGAFLLQDVFADVVAHAMVPDLLQILREWQPALVLRNDYEFGSCVAAERCGIPHATVSICFFMSEAVLSRAIGDRLAYLRSAFGLSPYPATAMLYPSLYLTYAPDVIEPRPDARMHGVRAVGRATGEAPAALQSLPPGPLVYVSLGTVFNRLDVFRTILEGLRDEPVNVLATVGRDLDPAALGPQPPHIRIERFVPQDAVLPYAALFITHSPFYTALSALRLGVPLLMVPQGGDQPAHALRLARHGVGLVLHDPSSRGPSVTAASKELTAGHVREAVRELLGDARFAAAARTVADAMSALPDVQHAVALLERLDITKTTVDA